MPTDVNHRVRLSSFRIGGREVMVGVVGIALAFLILLVSLLRISAMRVVAAEHERSGSEAAEVTMTDELAGRPGQLESGQTMASEAATENEYQLAYPGILPDHKLYFVKMIRDRVWSWLVTGDEERAKFLLLMADKRMAAARALVEKNKPDLAAITAAKAERYYQRAVEQAVALEGPEKTQMLTRLDAAGAKHTEVMAGLEQYLPITAEAAWSLAKETLRDAFDNQLRPKLDELGGQFEGAEKGQAGMVTGSE